MPQETLLLLHCTVCSSEAQLVVCVSFTEQNRLSMISQNGCANILDSVVFLFFFISNTLKHLSNKMMNTLFFMKNWRRNTNWNFFYLSFIFKINF